MLAHALVDAFVAPTEQRQPVGLFAGNRLAGCGGGQLLGNRLGENPPLGGEQDDRTGRRRAEHSFHGGKDRLGFHDHPTAAPIGHIVGDMVAIGGPVADVMQGNLNQAALAGLLQDAGLQIGLKHLGKESKNVEADIRFRHDSILAACGGEWQVVKLMLRRSRLDLLFYGMV